jgi:hypothetical protein
MIAEELYEMNMQEDVTTDSRETNTILLHDTGELVMMDDESSFTNISSDISTIIFVHHLQEKNQFKWLCVNEDFNYFKVKILHIFLLNNP